MTDGMSAETRAAKAQYHIEKGLELLGYGLDEVFDPVFGGLPESVREDMRAVLARYGFDDRALSAFRNLVARIDRDGGHAQQKDADIAATRARADAVVVDLLGAAACVAKLSKAVLGTHEWIDNGDYTTSRAEGDAAESAQMCRKCGIDLADAVAQLDVCCKSSQWEPNARALARCADALPREVKRGFMYMDQRDDSNARYDVVVKELTALFPFWNERGLSFVSEQVRRIVGPGPTATVESMANRQALGDAILRKLRAGAKRVWFDEPDIAPLLALAKETAPARPAYERALALIGELDAMSDGRVLHGALKAAMIALANSLDDQARK